jgi:hypothetical protein
MHWSHVPQLSGVLVPIPMDGFCRTYSLRKTALLKKYCKFKETLSNDDFIEAALNIHRTTNPSMAPSQKTPPEYSPLNIGFTPSNM